MEPITFKDYYDNTVKLSFDDHPFPLTQSMSGYCAVFAGNGCWQSIRGGELNFPAEKLNREKMQNRLLSVKFLKRQGDMFHPFIIWDSIRWMARAASSLKTYIMLQLINYCWKIVTMKQTDLSFLRNCRNPLKDNKVQLHDERSGAHTKPPAYERKVL